MSLSESDLYYLRSILRHLREVRSFESKQQEHWRLGSEVLADNIDWLVCFIDKHARKEKKE